MRVMALDYGMKRTGVAVCDELEITVRPVTTVRGKNRQAALEQIAQLVEELEPALLVIGLPLNLDGSEGEAANRVRAFSAVLAAFVNAPIDFQDERLTSYEADLLLRERGISWAERKETSDQWAAVVLLEDYLSAQKRK